MKLRVNFVNTWMTIGEMQITGVAIQPSRRMVEIELTDEQAKNLEREYVGSNHGNAVFDDIESMYFIEEKKL